jgi:hypothetical protein
MNKIVVGALTAVVLLITFPAGVHAQHASSQHNLGQPDYERTVSPGESVVLAHTKSPAEHTVCTSHHGTDSAIIHYDNNELPLGPGNCVMVEGSLISATPSGNSPVSVFGRHHIHHEHANQ